MLTPIKNRLLFTLALLLGALAATAQTGQVRGVVQDAKTGEPIIFTPIRLAPATYGAMTDVNGVFLINKVQPGNYTITIASLGYDTLKQAVSVARGEIVKLNLKLKERSVETEEIELTGNRDRTRRQQTVNASVTQISAEEIAALPSVGGEPDLVQYIQTLPGVVTTGDQGGQIYIRGGTQVQNLTYMDNILVYNPFHSIGLYSIFETDIIKNADVYTAAFGPEYGGRASSVIDVSTIDGNKNRIAARAGVNPVAARAMLEGPLFKLENGSAGTFVAAVRHSYLDRTSQMIYPYAVRDREEKKLPFAFTDFFGKFSINSGTGSKVSLTAFQHSDIAGLGPQSAFKWTQSGVGANFVVTPGSASSIISGNASLSNYQIGIREETTTPRSSSLSSFNGTINVTTFFEKNELKVGLGVVGLNSDFTGSSPSRLITNITGFNTEIFMYGKYRYVSPRLIIEPGLRLQYYASEAVNSLQPEPRVGAKFNLTENTRLKGAMGLYSQNLIAAQSDRDVVNLFSGFITNPDRIQNASGQRVNQALQLARHYVAGVEWDANNYLELGAEVYLKDFYQFININRERLSASDPDFILESSIAKGIDLLAKYDRRHYMAQISSSLARVEREYGGVVYPPNFDRRHNVQVLGYWRFGPKHRWEFDYRWNLGSGLPFTQTLAFYENLPFQSGYNANINQENGSLDAYYGTLANFNRGRLPWYHRLDLAVKRRTSFGKNGELEIIASVTNAYNRANVFYYDRVSRRRVNQLPVLPTLGVNIQF